MKSLIQQLIELVNSGHAPARGELRPNEDVVHDYYERILLMLDEFKKPIEPIWVIECDVTDDLYLVRSAKRPTDEQVQTIFLEEHDADLSEFPLSFIRDSVFVEYFGDDVATIGEYLEDE